jgi:hypothetical protein
VSPPILVSTGRSGDHVAVRIERREFCVALAALATAGACSTAPSEPPRRGLTRLLGLRTPDEEKWLDALSPKEQGELHQALLAPEQRMSRRTIDLVMKVVSRRERLFAYVGYPELQQVGVCDGLIRE